MSDATDPLAQTLDPETYARIRELFLAARTMPPRERDAFLAGECGDDARMRREILSLLDHAESEADIVDSPGLPSDDDPLSAIGKTLDDRYEVIRFVAEGGFSFVYRGTHLRWQQPIAIKFFKPLLAAADRQSLLDDFVQEGALLSKLSRRTTAVVQSYDLGTWQPPRGDEILYTVIEWLEGRSLAAELKADRTPWTVAQVIERLTPIAEALGIAHENGVAHRDVKPDNIFVVKEDGLPAMKLLDFGVAKVAAELSRGFASTAGAMSAFTASYATPEQVSQRHGPTGPWTDVYALALVCAELLSGKRPYGSTELMALMARVQNPDWRPTPKQLGVEVPPAVEAVLARAVDVQPERRYADAHGFWAALREAAAGQAAGAGPRWLRWLRRRR